MIFKTFSELTQTQKTAFYSLTAEYLPGSSHKKMSERLQNYGKTFIAALENEKVTGVCFGWPRKLDAPQENSFTLDGIAVTYQLWHKGSGSKMLSLFCAAAKAYGYDVVSVGSAGGYVEDFYLHNGFYPVEYKIWQDDKCVSVKKFENLQDYKTYIRPENQDGFVVMEKKI